MDIKDIQQLIDFIAHSGLDEVNVETSDLKISVRRFGAGTPAAATTHAPAPVAAAPLPAAAPASQPTAAAVVPAAPPQAETSGYITIKSPMIGTFYRSATPDSALFVEIGDSISEGKVVCIIEAMTPVEYDQPLFLVEPI